MNAEGAVKAGNRREQRGWAPEVATTEEREMATKEGGERHRQRWPVDYGEALPR